LFIRNLLFGSKTELIIHPSGAVFWPAKPYEHWCFRHHKGSRFNFKKEIRVQNQIAGYTGDLLNRDLHFGVSDWPIWGLGLADGTRTVSSLESPVNDNAFSGRVMSVQSCSLSGNQFGTLICALVSADISDTAPFLASFLGEFVCHPNFGYPAGNGSVLQGSALWHPSACSPTFASP
jgi:hypothetical protein